MKYCLFCANVVAIFDCKQTKKCHKESPSPCVCVCVSDVSPHMYVCVCARALCPRACVCVRARPLTLHSPVELLFPYSRRTIRRAAGLARQRRKCDHRLSPERDLFSFSLSLSFSTSPPSKSFHLCGPKARSPPCLLFRAGGARLGPAWIQAAAGADQTRRQSFDCHRCRSSSSSSAQLLNRNRRTHVI